MKLDELLGFVNFVAAKDQQGRSMTEVQFNYNLEAINDELFKEEWTRLQAFSMQTNVPLYRSLYNSTELNPFKVYLEVNTSGGEYTLPENFKYPLTMITKYGGVTREVELLTDQQMVDRRKAIVSEPLEFYPGAVLYSDKMRFWPTDVGDSEKIELTYLKYPTTPFYDYFYDNTELKRVYFDPADGYTISYHAATGKWRVMDGATVVYSDVTYELTDTTQTYSSRSVEIEWEQIQHVAFAKRMLRYIGINLRDVTLEQFITQFEHESK